jgi:hypothetical protein
VDKTDLMVEVMYRELEDFHNIQEEFVNEFSQEDFDWIVKVYRYLFYSDHFWFVPKFVWSVPKPHSL